MPIPNKKVAAPKSAKIRIYEALRDWIIDGTLKPGEKILDSEISNYFSVSRTPVREAMQLLADQKLIEIFPGRESRISEIGIVNVRQIYEMLADLHSLALKFAFPKITEETITRLKELNKKCADALSRGDHTDSRKYDDAFHDVIIQLADNDFLTDFTRTLQCHVARTENLYYDKLADKKDSIDEHQRIIEALEHKDLPAARQSMHDNWIHTVDLLEN